MSWNGLKTTKPYKSICGSFYDWILGDLAKVRQYSLSSCSSRSPSLREVKADIGMEVGIPVESD